MKDDVLISKKEQNRGGKGRWGSDSVTVLIIFCLDGLIGRGQVVDYRQRLLIGAVGHVRQRRRVSLTVNWSS
ncbi:hypothetical protein J6590_079860 [Homalodisca vitripennis]|nr:hypothetical protein J6590_079860 [Homalodisca vitripennis]